MSGKHLQVLCILNNYYDGENTFCGLFNFAYNRSLLKIQLKIGKKRKKRTKIYKIQTNNNYYEYTYINKGSSG